MSLPPRTVQLLESMSMGQQSLITAGIITEANSSPYTVALSDITGFSIYNWNDTNIITFTLTFEDASTMAIPVAVSSHYVGGFGQAITSIAYAGTAADFTAELLKRNV